MPRNEFAPNFCLMTDFDARPFTGTLYTAQNQSVVLPTASQIVFDNPIQFLNGQGMSENYSLKKDLEADKGGTWTISIDSQDRIKWERSIGINMDITTNSGGGQIWGLDNDYYEMISTEPAVFPNDWQRGNLVFWQSGNSNYGKITYLS